MRDSQEAIFWTRKAAEQGEADTQPNLGTLYAKGEGLAQGIKEAYVSLSVAVANGATGAVELRNQMAEQLSQPQLEIAQEVARQYFEKYHSRL